jgi:hypothetical protein
VLFGNPFPQGGNNGFESFTHGASFG